MGKYEKNTYISWAFRLCIYNKKLFRVIMCVYYNYDLG